MDLRFALSTLRHTPAFVAVLSLALGVDAPTAVFTVVDEVLLRLLERRTLRPGEPPAGTLAMP